LHQDVQLVLIEIDRIEQVEAQELYLVQIALQEATNTTEIVHPEIALIEEEQLVLEAQQDLLLLELQPIEAQAVEQEVVVLEAAARIAEAQLQEVTVTDLRVVAQVQEAVEAIEVQVAVLEVLVVQEAQVVHHVLLVVDLLAEADLQAEEDNKPQTFRNRLKF